MDVKVLCKYCGRPNDVGRNTCEGCAAPLPHDNPENIMPDPALDGSASLNEIQGITMTEDINKYALGFKVYAIHIGEKIYYMGVYRNDNKGLNGVTLCHSTMQGLVAEIGEWKNYPFSIDDMGFESETVVANHMGWLIYSVKTKHGIFYRGKRHNVSTFLFKTIQPIVDRIDRKLTNSTPAYAFDAFYTVEHATGPLMLARYTEAFARDCRTAFDVIDLAEADVEAARREEEARKSAAEFLRKHPLLAAFLGIEGDSR